MKTNKITFIAQTDSLYEIVEKPVPAAKMVPQWWKDLPKYVNSEDFPLNPAPNLTAKNCAPLIDTLQTGYILPLWSDIIVKQENGMPVIKWNAVHPVIDIWPPEQVSSFEFADGYSRFAFKYLHKWIIKTPPGWSTLFIQPVGYSNLPIKVIPGVVDTDILETDINCPFMIKEGFEGVIKKGTPMMQVIPIKREKWEMECVPPKGDLFSNNVAKIRTELFGYYYSRRAKKSYK